MRFRKATKNKKAVATLGEDDILDAAYEFLRTKGHNPGDRCYFKIRFPKKDKVGRKMRTKVEVGVELKE